MSPDVYNYAHFVLDENEQRNFDAFPTLTQAGAAAVDGELVDARTEARVTLSSLWKHKHLILEFGSFT